MDEITRRLFELTRFSSESLWNVVDILLVSYLIYRLLVLVRNTRAWRILIGIVVFIGALYVSDVLQLRTLHWILDRATALAPVALVILLLPELRHTLEGFARLGLWTTRLGPSTQFVNEATINHIVAGATELASQRIGAIIVIERDNSLEDVIKTGVQLDAKLSAAILGSIFYDKNPLHDGAVIVRGEKIVSAACQLPLSENELISRMFHMRHRAGVGISEQTDCISLMISEERGTMTVASDGKLKQLDGPAELREVLNQALRRQESKRRNRKAEVANGS